MKKNILLIGGSYGIGEAIVKTLTEKNYHCFVAARTLGNLDPNKITYLPFDATTNDLKNIELPEVIDGFVYLPGTINLRPFKNIKAASFQEDFNINVMGMINSLQAVLPKLTKSDQASVVLFSSVAVKLGMPFHTSVSTSKGAVEGFAKAFAAEYAPKVRCNVIAPSLTNTPLASKLLSDDSKIENAGQRHPLKRVGNVQDMANMTYFLLSEQSSWITGQVLSVDGGMSALK